MTGMLTLPPTTPNPPPVSQYMPLALTQREAELFHHFIHHLGRWLDCTSAGRVFTLSVSEQAGTSPVLLNAVYCFAARHKGAHEESERAYERCIELLIEKLGTADETHDDCLLAAVLMLHFADQLDGRCLISLVLFCGVLFCRASSGTPPMDGGKHG